MVELVVGIQTRSCFLTRGCIRRVDKKYGAFLVGILAYDLDTVAFEKGDDVLHNPNILDAFAECIWIPARTNSFPVFTLLKDSAARSEYSAVVCAIAQKSLKGKLTFSFRRPCKFGADIL